MLRALAAGLCLIAAFAPSSVATPSAQGPEIFSLHYGAGPVASIAAEVKGLLHGPELDRLSVYVATPEEIAGICGESVIACYQPETEKMIVSGADHAAGGVPRDFAIAHEYGHHIANSQEGAIFPAMDVGTARWATYERVCQLTRARKLFPGDQGNHYFEDPEEAFAEAYAHLADPKAKVSWQYAPFLRPTAESMKKIRKDIVKPWRGPVAESWRATVLPSQLPASRPIEAPLDGYVSVSVAGPVGAGLTVSLLDAGSRRLLASAVSDEAGFASLDYANCGHPELRVAVTATRAGGPFSAKIERP